MALINSEINPDLLSDEFIKNGSVIIRDFLTDEYANKLHEFFEYGMPKDWWYSVSYPGTNNFVEYLRDFEHNQEKINIEKSHSDFIFSKNEFSYHFYRTAGDHVQNCYCQECEFRNWLNSEELLGFMGKVAGKKFTSYSTMFGSKYSEGCFLSPHHDVNLGSIGFVLQLTKDWKPQWGGVLHFLNDDLTKIDISETPTFNTLTLFHLPEGEGKWHYVSHVNPGVKSNRIAYSGWYN
jgi:Rps23 Pro-64 3,4-dihydroxylase Tpa1-like proline 4-hydroxylase